MTGTKAIQISLALGIETMVWIALVECYRVFVGGPGTSSFREALGLLISARILFWVADVLRRYLVWRAVFRNQRVEYIVGLLRSADFPAVTTPDSFANYMYRIEEDDRAPMPQRVLARDFRIIEEVIEERDWIAGAQLFWERIYVMQRLLETAVNKS